MNDIANNFKTIVTFYDTQSIAKITGSGGMKEYLINPRKEYSALNALKGTTLVNGVNEKIRDSTHIIQTRFRSDLNYFTTVSREYLSSDYKTIFVQTFKVNDIQIIGQENRYIVAHLTLQNNNADLSSMIGNIVTADEDDVDVNNITVTAGFTNEN